MESPKELEKPSEKSPARNEPCPCGSGRKYKRCCGVNAAPVLNTAPAISSDSLPGTAAGFDPSQLDPQMMMQMAQMMQRLPKGQLQRLQGLVQKAMSGRDVSREAAELERTLPPQFQEMMKSFVMPGMAGMANQPAADASTPSGEMSEDQARAIVQSALDAGTITEDEAKKALGEESLSSGESEKKGFSKIWKKISGK